VGPAASTSLRGVRLLKTLLKLNKSLIIIDTPMKTKNLEPHAVGQASRGVRGGLIRARLFFTARKCEKKIAKKREMTYQKILRCAVRRWGNTFPIVGRCLKNVPVL
jgi:hypothetical protein